LSKRRAAAPEARSRFFALEVAIRVRDEELRLHLGENR
jgi:hypothetical protein